MSSSPANQNSKAKDTKRVSESKLLVKTQRCKYHERGKCSKGDDCSYIHDPVGGCPQRPCFAYAQKEYCKHGDDCKFSHDIEDRVENAVAAQPDSSSSPKKKPKRTAGDSAASPHRGSSISVACYASSGSASSSNMPLPDQAINDSGAENSMVPVTSSSDYLEVANAPPTVVAPSNSSNPAWADLAGTGSDSEKAAEAPTAGRMRSTAVGSPASSPSSTTGCVRSPVVDSPPSSPGSPQRRAWADIEDDSDDDLVTF